MDGVQPSLNNRGLGNTAIQGFVPRCNNIVVQSDCRIQILERMERIKFTRREWLSASAGERITFWLHGLRERHVAISEATAAVTQALHSTLPATETSAARIHVSFYIFFMSLASYRQDLGKASVTDASCFE